jgi:hypothetical protein
MASAERKAADQKIVEENFHNSLAAEERQAETDAFQCSRCKQVGLFFLIPSPFSLKSHFLSQRKCRYRQAQTRSADEPMTVCFLGSHRVTHNSHTPPRLLLRMSSLLILLSSQDLTFSLERCTVCNNRCDIWFTILFLVLIRDLQVEILIASRELQRNTKFGLLITELLFMLVIFAFSLQLTYHIHMPSSFPSTASVHYSPVAFYSFRNITFLPLIIMFCSGL